MKKELIYHNSPESPPLLISPLQQPPMTAKHAVDLPRWRHPVVGYLLSIPLVAVGLALPWIENVFARHYYFLCAPFFLIAVLVALVWGIGPSIFSIILGFLALDYFFVPPAGFLFFQAWQDLWLELPYLVAALAVTLITAWLEREHRQAQREARALRLRAEELEQANQQLTQSHRLKDIFFSRASHELKTPLTTIYGQAQLGLRRCDRLATSNTDLTLVRFSLEKIDDQTQRLQTLLEDLSDVEMMMAGKLRMQMAECDLCYLCQSLIDEQREASGRTIQLDMPKESVMIRGDSLRLTQVMINLVSNAIKYSLPDSPINVNLKKQDTHAELQVSNIGTPIPEAQWTSIFEPFYRVPDEEVTNKRGWGLGLAICRDIVFWHGGNIHVESSADQTTFFIELPLA
ncbi:sensor histidine kinase [Dictyobacter kobayashii]|uniref:histidine kinase n=1 Tax=Dictyobacter kobayashii TaxID=2014872 RepID=A0A402ABY4_9CHLR|nr:HAMP domain-containing sensor histidine kinase [Dictyobacter kobayashii]GCE16588.1 hypothetical protein KDK_03880 [Dictyobacter kobayashii]